VATPNIEGYDIGEQVGRGGFASVHRAIGPDGHQVAIKTLFAHVQDTGDLKRFERERLSMSALGGHPHIVGIYDSGETDEGHHWMAIEYVDGGSIKDQVAANGAFHWSAVTRIGVQLCSALDAAHRSGVLHRDIKPANILDDGDAAKLADFGIARLTGQSQLTAAQSIIGTLAYTPPEILHNQGFDGRGDIYQLGISLYEMLLGRAPFKSGTSDNKAMVIRRILENPAPPLAQFDIPQPLSDLLDDVLAKDPAARPQTAGEFGRRLNEVEVVLGRPATPAPGIRAATPPPAAPTPKPAEPVAAPPVVAPPTSPAPDPDATLADFTRPDHTSVMPPAETIVAQPARPTLDPEPAAATSAAAAPPARRRGRTAAVVFMGVAALGVAGALLVQAVGADDDPGTTGPGAGDDTELEIEPTLVQIDQAAFSAPDGDVGIIFGAVANEVGLTVVGSAGDGEEASQQQSVMWTMDAAGQWAHMDRFASVAGADPANQRLRGIGLLDRTAFLAVGESGRTGTDGVAWIGNTAANMRPLTHESFTGPGPQRLLAAAGDNARGEFLVAGSTAPDGDAVPGLWVVAPGEDWTDPIWAQVPLDIPGSGALTDVAVAGDIAVAIGHTTTDGTPAGLVLVRQEGTWSTLLSPIAGVELQAVDLVGDRIVAVGNQTVGADVQPIALVADVSGSQPQLHRLPAGNGDARAHDVVATRAGIFAVGIAAEVAGSAALDQGLVDGAIWQLLPADDPADERWTTRDSDELRVDGRQEFWSVVEFDGAVFALGRAATGDGGDVAAAWTVTVDLGDSPDTVDDVVEQAQREAADGDSPLGLALGGCAAEAVADVRTTSPDATLRPVLIDATDRFALWICMDDANDLWYHGAERDGSRSITLPANEVAGGYEATNVGPDGATTIYRVVDGRLTVQNPNGSIALDQPLLDN
jgi:serine/threonine protein kinase